MGHEVVAAENGAEAVDLCLRERPEVVILDFLMPKLSGLDALKLLRERGSTVPAILLTAISDSSLRDVPGSEQPDAILEKPFRRKTLEKAILHATGRG
jgi:CheY-like chemotaxis protein